jgi:cytosine/adenosine deaminase-related metal-dependent hydrolase
LTTGFFEKVCKFKPFEAQMAYRKWRADGLFTGTVLLNQDQVLITKEERIEAIVDLQDAGSEIEFLPGLICPGFVNSHCHLELSHLRGMIPQRTGLVDFLITVISKRQARPEFILEMAESAEQEMYFNGIVAVGDISNNIDSFPIKANSSLIFHHFIETMGIMPQVASERYLASVRIRDRVIAENFSQMERVSIVPHAPYSVSKNLFEKIAMDQDNHLLSIHNQEDPEENRFFLHGDGEFQRLYRDLGIDPSNFHPTGKRSLESYLPYFRPDQRMILVHNVDMKKEDLEKNRREGLYFCLCPNANLYISGNLPDLGLFMEEGVSLVIGTDSLASNKQLSILEELKTLQAHYPQIETTRLLGWATINGARALGTEGLTGSFEKGKKPGVLHINNLRDGKFSSSSSVKRLV